MNYVVCIACDAGKSSADLAEAERDGVLAWCEVCGKHTRDREVASDAALIAPGSALRFREQREIFEQERRRA